MRTGEIFFVKTAPALDAIASASPIISVLTVLDVGARYQAAARLDDIQDGFAARPE